jgi:uncharacterized alpha-E superfamily protein
MISRVADHCFWVGRYLDRSESTARLLQVTRALAFDAELPDLPCWRPLITVSGQDPDFVARFGADAGNNGEVVQRYMTWAAENPVSIRNSIRAAREAARSIREVLSLDIWQATNELFLWFVGEEATNQYLQDRDELYRHIRRSTQLSLGLVRSTMLHDTPMDILWLGVLLERIGQTARILDMHHHMLEGTGGAHQILETSVWLSLLRACSGFEAFIRQHQGRVSRGAVVSFLIFEARFPRALRYCIRSAVSVVRRICGDAEGPSGGAAAERLATLDAWLSERQREPAASIHELLTHVIDEVAAVCGELQQSLSGAHHRDRDDDEETVVADATQAQSQ